MGKPNNKNMGVTSYTISDGVVLISPGPNGKSYITGDAGPNTLWGGNGKDTIIGGAGIDQLHGGNGDDLFLIDSATDGGSGETYDGGRGAADELQITGTAILNLSDDILLDLEVLRMGTGRQILQLQNNQVASFKQIFSDYPDTIAVTDIMQSNMLDNTIINGSLVIQLLHDTATNSLTLVNNTLGTTGTLYVEGYVLAPTSAILNFNGSAETAGGKVQVFGSNGTDTFIGTTSDDTLLGGGGADNLTGGFGADQFIFTSSASTDTIADFTVAQNDQLVFDISDLGLNANDYTQGAVTIIDLTAANLLGPGAIDNNIIVDTAANIALFTNGNGQFSGPALAIATDTGEVIYDANANFSGGDLNLATITPAQALIIANGNLLLIA